MIAVLKTESSPWENEENLREFARQFVRSGNTMVAVQRARVQNPEMRLSVWADRLLARKDVQRYIAEYEQTEKREGRTYTREGIAEDFQEIFERAMAVNELAPAVSAKAKQAELLGLMEKNVRISVTTSVKDMSMEDLERELARLKEDGVITLTAGEDGVFRAEGDE